MPREISSNLKIFSFAFLISIFFFFGINVFQKNLENFLFAQITQPFGQMNFIQIPKKERPQLDLRAKAFLSIKIRRNTKEKVLFEKNSKEILPIASLTKLMTALVFLEEKKEKELKETSILISEKAANQTDVPNYGNLKKGGEWNLEKLLELMLIYSSNDATFALAENENEEKFISKMNQKAKELDLKNTYFVNPTGLDPENLSFSQENLDYFNFSTAQDLFKLTKFILNESPLIFEISRKKGDFLVENGILDLSLNNFKILGGKTGFTPEAGGCLILVLEDERGNKFVNIILGADTLEGRIEEMKKLIEMIK